MKPSGHNTVAPTLVIGFGSDLRGDDAIGPEVAERIDALKLPNVEVVRCHQLTPELAETISTAARVLFVDACVQTDPGNADLAPQLTALHPAPTTTGLGHACEPSGLLELAQVLYGHHPEAWLIAVPAVSFELGAPLSAQARQGVLSAVQIVSELCADASRA